MLIHRRENTGLGFTIGAPSMVFGEDLLTNVQILSGLLDHIEIVLFYTPTLHNIPTQNQIKELRTISSNHPVTFSVHLPASLEVACSDPATRRDAIRLAAKLIKLFRELDPLHVVLHIPFTRPTLTAVPGQYFGAAHRSLFEQWLLRATEALECIRAESGATQLVLAENINYSPVFLDPLLHADLCRLCLDFGHLVLGNEPVMDTANRYWPYTAEVHLHGVRNFVEHLSLDVFPNSRISRWISGLVSAGYAGPVVLEVFTPADLEASLRVLARTRQDLEAYQHQGT